MKPIKMFVSADVVVLLVDNRKKKVEWRTNLITGHVIGTRSPLVERKKRW